MSDGRGQSIHIDPLAMLLCLLSSSVICLFQDWHFIISVFQFPHFVSLPLNPPNIVKTFRKHWPSLLHLTGTPVAPLLLHLSFLLFHFSFSKMNWKLTRRRSRIAFLGSRLCHFGTYINQCTCLNWLLCGAFNRSKRFLRRFGGRRGWSHPTSDLLLVGSSQLRSLGRVFPDKPVPILLSWRIWIGGRRRNLRLMCRGWTYSS